MLFIFYHMHCKYASYISERLSTETYGPVAFYSIKYFDFHSDLQTKYDWSEPRMSTCHTDSTFITAPNTTQRRKEATKFLDHAMDPSKTWKRMLYHSSGWFNTGWYPWIPEICQDAICSFWPHCKMHTTPNQGVTNFRMPLLVGLKRTITLSYLATG